MKQVRWSSLWGDDAHEVPYYTIDPVAVTAENIDEVIIGSDFHTREDVYRNVTE